MTVFLFQSSSRTTGVISNMYWFRILKKEKKAYLVQIFFLGDNTLNQNSRIILINLAFRY